MTLFRHVAASNAPPTASAPPRSVSVVSFVGRIVRPLGERISSAWATVVSLATWPGDFLRAFFGPCEFTVGEGGFCAECNDAHAVGQCARAMVAECDICIRTVTLDHFGNCPNGGTNHRVVNRRPKVRVPKWA
jgi:hypothetical protein